MARTLVPTPLLAALIAAHLAERGVVCSLEPEVSGCALVVADAHASLLQEAVRAHTAPVNPPLDVWADWLPLVSGRRYPGITLPAIIYGATPQDALVTIPGDWYIVVRKNDVPVPPVPPRSRKATTAAPSDAPIQWTAPGKSWAVLSRAGWAANRPALQQAFMDAIAREGSIKRMDLGAYTSDWTEFEATAMDAIARVEAAAVRQRAAVRAELAFLAQTLT